MGLDMADMLLGSVPYDCKLSAIRLQLRDGGIEIGPPRAPVSTGDDESGVTDIILQVYNEYAEEVAIEYQPAAKREDTRWGFWCDGHTLKTVIPYHFWKTYLYPDFGPGTAEEQKGQLPLQDTSALCAGASASSPMAGGIHICRCPDSRRAGVNNRLSPHESLDFRQIATALRPIQAAAGPAHCAATRADADGTRVIKVRCKRPSGSSSPAEDFEREIRVKCSRPVSPIRATEPESKMRCSGPISPTQVFEAASKARRASSSEGSERSLESRCGTPTSAAEALLRAKEALARVQQMSEREATRSRCGSPAGSFDRLSESRCSTPCLPSEALARAKYALARVNSLRPPHRPSSTPKLKVPSRRYVADTDSFVRPMSASTTDTSPLSRASNPSERGVFIDTSDLRPTKCFSGDTSDLAESISQATCLFGSGQQMLRPAVFKHEQTMEPTEIWKAAFEKFREKASFVKHGSKEYLKDVIEFILKEKTALLSNGKKYIKSKRKELDFGKLECIFCLRVTPSMTDPEGDAHWTGSKNVPSWEKTQITSHQKSTLVTTGTNTKRITH